MKRLIPDRSASLKRPAKMSSEVECILLKDLIT